MSVAASTPFSFLVPVTFFEKASADEGKRKRFAGVVCTEIKDKQRETLIQKGLDFASYFLKSGWFNDNHSKDTDAVVGEPADIIKFRKGDVLPDGTKAKFNGTWAEGYMLGHERAQRIWETGMGMVKAGSKRRLGFSVEGDILARDPSDPTVVTKALVRHIAITTVPVGEETAMSQMELSKALEESNLEQLAKSMDAVEQAALEKGATMGTPAPGHNASEAGPVTGEGAGRVLAKQDLDDDEKKKAGKIKPLGGMPDEDDVPFLTKSEALGVIQDRLGCNSQTAERAFRVISLMNKSADASLERQGNMTDRTNLDRGLNALEAQLAIPARYEDLFRKSLNGSATAEEREELNKAMGNGTQNALEPLKKNETLSKAMDASSFLREQHNGIVYALESMSTLMEKSLGNSGEFQKSMGNAMLEIGKEVIGQGRALDGLLKSIQDMNTKLDTWGSKPAAQPRSQNLTGAQPLNKSFTGNAPQRDDPKDAPASELNISMVKSFFTDMAKSGQQHVGHENIDEACANFELSGLLSKSMCNAVITHSKQNRTQAA